MFRGLPWVGSILARAILMCLVLGIATHAQAQTAIIEINDTATQEDDYFCWSPTPARVRSWQAGALPVRITLQGEEIGGGGAVAFQDREATHPTPVDFAPTSSIALDLPADGGWVPFWIAGVRASAGSKDVGVIARDEGGNEIARAQVMVRVRKDAEKLTVSEINQFLSALRRSHDLDNSSLQSSYVKHYRAHDEAFRFGIHDGNTGAPLFFAWHRAFLLNLERELQDIDPAVALPYWRFDQRTTKLFTTDFIGTVRGSVASAGSFLVTFAPTNPLFGWRMPDGRGALVRERDGELGPIPANRLRELFDAVDSTGQLVNHTYRPANGAVEFRYHNGAHSEIGGWLGSGSSPRDPLFFLLHANVDRVWAHWQAEFERFDPADLDAYHAQGAYPGPSSPLRFRKGSYLQDEMWPWSGSGGSRARAIRDDWPDFGYAVRGTGRRWPH